MTKRRKFFAIAGLALAVGGAAVFSIYRARRGVVAVEAAPVARKDLTSIVTASGEIRPKNYTNVLAEGFGKITEILVHEGQWVRQGDVLLRVESTQPAADVAAQRAALSSAEAAVRAAEASYRSATAEVNQQKANLDKARFDWEQGQKLYSAQLIALQEYQARKAAFEAAQAALSAAQARMQQTRAQLAQARAVLDQTRAQLTRVQDVLRKTTYRAPISGMVTYIAVRVGENVVPGIQNAQGSYLMTISDMSVVTAEVRVDETDITSIRTGQPAEVTIDALPGQTFSGHVTEVGTQAIVRSTGLATTQTTTSTEQAKDFKVVITLDQPPANLRPGLTVTAKIQTAHRSHVLAVPIQALVVRTRGELRQAEHGASSGTVSLAAATQPDADAGQQVQGVFVIRNGRAVFVPVQTGIMGITDIEVTGGLQEGDWIVVGSYRVLRTLRPGASVRVQKQTSTPTS
jgi:HlyD family secretion protein